MADPQVELQLVKDELSLLEQQLEELLERQGQLFEKKRRLEQVVQESLSISSTTSQQNDFSKTDFSWSKKLDELRLSVFNLHHYRPLQLQTMNATLSGKDCILIMPTGGGKSLCFQLPALVSKGITLVVSPLISLMEDQLMALHSHGVDATLLNASSTREEVNQVHNSMTDPKSSLKLLYVTPEKLAKSKRFMAKLEKMYAAGRFARLVIDEVHCCSQWGHDFRPDYKFLGVMKRQFANVPILGLTATATSHVVQDVKKILGLPQCTLFRASFNRHNLYYEVKPKAPTLKASLDELQSVIGERFRNKSGIVYCFSRKDCEDVARELKVRGIEAAAYHADLDAKYRSRVHQMWINNNIQVVVATIAFGMGIDKPDVRFVIHHSLSKSMENYYQESGRAGRDDEKAYCILYTSFSDIFRQSTMVFTEQTGLDKLYGMVGYAYNINKCRRTLIACHFGERWNVKDCNQMCDKCDPLSKMNAVKKDIGSYCCDLLAILDHAKAANQRMTGLKLIDSWLGKGGTGLRLKTVTPPSLPRTECERVIAYLLLHSYLREDFHFTPYNTISYILPGSRSQSAKNGAVIEMEFDIRNNKSTSSAKASSSTSVKSTAKKKSTSNSQEKPKVVVINHKKSAFCDIEGKNDSPTQSTSTTGNSGDRLSEDKMKLERKVSRKRKVVIESDSDDENLFFDLSDNEQEKNKKEKSNKVLNGKTKHVKNNKSSKTAIIIDDSDEDMHVGHTDLNISPTSEDMEEMT